MYTSFVVVTVNVIGNILLIPKYRLVGAAAATTIAYSLNLVLRLWIYGRFSGNRCMESVFVRVEDVRMAREMVSEG